MSENLNRCSTGTMKGESGTMEKMESVSVTQRFFSIDMGQEGTGNNVVVLDDAGRPSLDLEPDTVDKIPRRHAPLYAFLAFMSLLLIGILTQDDIEQFFKQPLSIQRIGKAVWADNPVAAPREIIRNIPPGDVVIPTIALTTLEAPKPRDATEPLPTVTEMLGEDPPTPSIPSIRNRSPQRTQQPPTETAQEPSEPVPFEAEVNDVSPFEQNAESVEGIDSAPLKHPLPNRATNPFEE